MWKDLVVQQQWHALLTTGNIVAILTLIQVHRRVLMSLYLSSLFRFCLLLWYKCGSTSIPTPCCTSRHDAHNKCVQRHSFLCRLSSHRHGEFFKKGNTRCSYEISISFTVFKSVCTMYATRTSRVSIHSLSLSLSDLITKQIHFLMGTYRMACQPLVLMPSLLLVIN